LSFAKLSEECDREDGVEGRGLSCLKLRALVVQIDVMVQSPRFEELGPPRHHRVVIALSPTESSPLPVPLFVYSVPVSCYSRGRFHTLPELTRTRHELLEMDFSILFAYPCNRKIIQL
jgi:hypothetical protein